MLRNLRLNPCDRCGCPATQHTPCCETSECECREYVNPDTVPKCKCCGIAFEHHAGVQLLCQRYYRLKSEVDAMLLRSADGEVVDIEDILSLKVLMTTLEHGQMHNDGRCVKCDKRFDRNGVRCQDCYNRVEA